MSTWVGVRGALRAIPLVLFLLAGCEVVDLPLVDVDAGDSFMPQMGAPCSNNAGCLGGQFCEKPSCGAALGRCVQQPQFCDGDSRPECGCDGVTYWNDCLRRKAGEGFRDRGPCVNPKPCGVTSPCDGDAVCGYLVAPNQCGLVPSGACFVLPETCQGAGPDHFIPCAADAGVTQCLDACAAIRSGQPAARFPGPCP